MDSSVASLPLNDNLLVMIHSPIFQTDTLPGIRLTCFPLEIFVNYEHNLQCIHFAETKSAVRVYVVLLFNI